MKYTVTMHRILDKVESFSRKREFKAGSTILFQGEVPRYGYMVKSGFIKLYTISNNGNENIVFIGGPNTIIPLAWILQSTDIALFNYEAYTDVILNTFGRENFTEMLKSNPEFYPELLKDIGHSYSSSLLHISALEQTYAEDKILHTLYYLIYQFGVLESDNRYSLSFKMNHQMLADLVGITRESTTKILSKLKNKKIISNDRHEITIDKTLLEKSIGEDVITNF